MGLWSSGMIEAVKGLQSHKAAGVDGIPSEVLKECWEEMGDKFHEQMEQALGASTLAFILRCPRAGLNFLLTNYRPISVLPAVFKAMVKAMANRMQPFLPLWIHPLQTGFVKERCILDNVFMAYESMEYAKEIWCFLCWTLKRRMIRSIGRFFKRLC